MCAKKEPKAYCANTTKVSSKKTKTKVTSGLRLRVRRNNKKLPYPTYA